MKLSACMIAKNEERCIARCIKSYQKIVDEIIVVDTGSTDKTVEIAKSLGAKVFHFTWVDDFSKAKNEAISHATGDWILSLDADEYFEGDSAANTLAFIKALPADVEALDMRRYDFLRPGEPPTYFTMIRAFRNSPSIRYTYPIHEFLQNDGNPLKVATAPADKISILHDGYVGPIGRGKAQRNLEILQRLVNAGDDDPMLQYYIGQALITQRRYAETYRHTKEFLERDGAQNAVAMTAFLRCEQCLNMMGPADFESEEAWTAARESNAAEAVRRFPQHPSARLLAGNAFFAHGDLARAAAEYEKAVTLRETFADESGYSENLVDERYPAIYTRLAMCRRMRGDLPGALACCAKALDETPDLAAAALEFLLCTKAEDPQQTAAALLRWFDRAPDKKVWLAAAREVRCDLLYLILFDRCNKEAPRRDFYFTSMQAAIGEYESAVMDVIARVVNHPHWQLCWERSFAALAAEERMDLELSLATAAAAALANGDVPLLRQLHPVCPPGLRDAVALSLGDEVEHPDPRDAAMVQAVGKNLAALGAPEDITAIWREVAACFAS